MQLQVTSFAKQSVESLRTDAFRPVLFHSPSILADWGTGSLEGCHSRRSAKAAVTDFCYLVSEANQMSYSVLEASCAASQRRCHFAANVHRMVRV